MDNIINILKMSALLSPIYLLSKKLLKINLEKPERVKQFPMPILGLIYVCSIMITARRIREGILNVINFIPRLIVLLGSKLNLSNAFNSIASLVLSFIKSVNWEIWIAFILCIFAMTMYIAFKKIAIAIIKKVIQPGNKIVTILSERFYQYDKSRDLWFLNEDCVDTRTFFKVAYYSSMFISFITMMITKYLAEDGVLSELFYPVYIIILIGEVYCYLDGITKKEYLISIYGDEEKAKRVANYSLMRTFLRNLFGDKALNEGTSVNVSLNDSLTNDELIRKYEIAEDQESRSFAKFYKLKLKNGMKLDQNYYQSSYELLKGNSILFNNPFYYDLLPYAFYPMHASLLAHKKALIILGRHGVDEEIIKWLETGIKSITNIPYFWNIGVLNNEEFEGDIGIISRSNISNINLIQNNQEFLSKVEYVVVIEPNKLITTAQVGLNLIVKKCREINSNKKIVYCMIDKNCDGLVDAMSHILLESISEVSATNKHKGTVSHMSWESSEEYLHHRIVPNISRYLGIGTELSFAALKNQIQKTRWYGGEAFPVVDIKWIAKQYYHDFTRYANLPSNQGLVDEMFETSSGYWDAPVSENSYITVEDESYNLFEILRNFSTRSESQGFVNIISQNYLLRDYMAKNASMFLTDAKAIPNIVADYSKTNRNVVLSAILRMSNHSVPEEELIEELSLIGIKVNNLKKRFWYEIYKCFVNSEECAKLSQEYENAYESIDNRTIVKNGKEFDITILESKEEYNYLKGKMERSICITNRDFINAFVNDLKLAAYVAEDELEKNNYLGSELVSQVYQKHLPGQFLTLSGKYYQLKGVTANNEIVVRRAADHIDNRFDYRQIREYSIKHIEKSNKINEYKKINDFVVGNEYADFEVTTNGYYKLNKYNDLKSSSIVVYDKNNAIPKREYLNKRILRVQLPDKGMNEEIKYTLTLLINEIFKSLFAENQAYIVALTKHDLSIERNPLTFTISGEEGCIDDNSIYFIEDSQLDMGLLEAVERNLNRILEIVCDYLEWHFDAYEESLHPTKQENLEYEIKPTTEAALKNTRKENIFKKAYYAIVGLFKKKNKKKDKPALDTNNVESLDDDKNEIVSEKEQQTTDNLEGHNDVTSSIEEQTFDNSNNEETTIVENEDKQTTDAESNVISEDAQENADKGDDE